MSKTEQELISAYSNYFGEEIDSIHQITTWCTTGEELLDFVEFFLNFHYNK